MLLRALFLFYEYQEEMNAPLYCMAWMDPTSALCEQLIILLQPYDKTTMNNGRWEKVKDSLVQWYLS